MFRFFFDWQSVLLQMHKKYGNLAQNDQPQAKL
jgi:hypothetical protein